MDEDEDEKDILYAGTAPVYNFDRPGTSGALETDCINHLMANWQGGVICGDKF